MKTIYAIFDRKAKEIGPLMLHRHDAPAIRSFGDIAAMPDTSVAKHPADYDLVALGEIGDFREDEQDIPLHPDYRIVITGEQWLAAQTPTPTTHPELTH